MSGARSKAQMQSPLKSRHCTSPTAAALKCKILLQSCIVGQISSYPDVTKCEYIPYSID